MMAVPEEASAPACDPVHRERDAREEQLHPACELFPVLGLDQQVDVIVLDREMNDADAAGNRSCHLPADRAEDALRPEARRQARALDRDVNRVSCVVDGAPDVRNWVA